jgi:T4 RnlA family RNA ligase
MEYYIPTYEEARAICDAYDNFQFYETIRFIDGYKVSCFNYRFVTYNDFNAPLKDRPEVKAFELRGLCFVFNEDGTLFKTYLLMNKYFNLNENETTQLDAIKHIPIKTVEDKLDGSLISFIKLPNDKIYAKSKMVLDSDQAIAAQKLYEENETIGVFVRFCLRQNIIPMFEYVSPSNRVVLKYNKSNLVLIKTRNNITGEYIDPIKENIERIGITFPDTYSYITWDEILPLKETLCEKEGFVITLENGMMLKFKTEWYCSRHHLLTETLHREDFLIEKVVKDEIDDILASVDSNDEETLALITTIREKVVTYLKTIGDQVEQKLEVFNKQYNGNVKEFCINEKHDKIRNFVLLTIKGKSSLLDIIKNDLLKQTYHLQNARKFLTIDFT